MTDVTERAGWGRCTTVAVILAGLALLGCGTDEDPDAQPSVEDDIADDGEQVPDDEGTDPDDEGTEPDDEGTEPDDEGTDPDDEGTDPDDEGTDDEESEAPEDDGAQEEGSGDDTDDVAPVAEGGDTEANEAEGESPGVDDDDNLRAQAVTDVRVASHDGFDRVVFELESDGGTPGWFIEYDDPTAQGSGNPVEVDGDASLTVMIHPVSLPPDLPSDVQTWEGDPIDGPEGGIVQQVVGGSVYEGYHQFFIGTDEQRPFAVERFDDPPRVVIDIFHEES